jgi:hypothetical protein
LSAALSSTPFCVADRGVASTERGQHVNRQTFESAFSVSTVFAQCRLGVQR